MMHACIARKVLLLASYLCYNACIPIKLRISYRFEMLIYQCWVSGGIYHIAIYVALLVRRIVKLGSRSTKKLTLQYYHWMECPSIFNHAHVFA